ncbi:MAG: type II secretion system secretin GspD [Lentisphaerae bacterium]|nr:type II secretion system secretin GspD [Lentisphaerota bacterium]
MTLKCPQRIPRSEALLAIEGILGMHGIALVPMGDKFLRVVPIAVARQSGMPTGTGPLSTEIEETGHLVSRIVELKHIETSEAQSALENLISPSGKIMTLDRINCLLITDSAINLKRIYEILELLDLPMGSREELRIFPIIHAKASEVQAKIETIIADADASDNRSDMLRRQLLASRLRRSQPPAGAPGFQPQQPATDTQAGTEKGLVQGRVKIVADDRTNALIIIARPDQFAFFENIIEALDKQVEPEVAIKVIRLEYADAEKVVTVLNNLVGTGEQGSARSGSADSAGLQRSVNPLMPSPPAIRSERDTSAGPEITIEGRLSADVKIIADPRINALLIMASRSDMTIIEDVLSKVDVMLSQVLIEVVIIEVGLDDQVRLGVDWLQRSMIAYNEQQGGGSRPFMSFAGTSRAQTAGQIRNASLINTVADNTAAAGSGLTYYFTLFDLNVDAVLNMLATTSEARILSTPIILTTDNTEAKILVGEKRPIVTSTSMSAGGVQQSAYQYTNIGIELNVTPRINKKGFVVMEINQKIDNTGSDVRIDNNLVPVITTREFNASIAVDDGRTIVLGGLVSTDDNKGRSKIPILGDIPLLGLLFRSDNNKNTRRELLVMITPYVLDTPQKVLDETSRRHGAMGEMTNMWMKGWSASDLAAPALEEEDAEQD